MMYVAVFCFRFDTQYCVIGSYTGIYLSVYALSQIDMYAHVQYNYARAENENEKHCNSLVYVQERLYFIKMYKKLINM